MTKLQKLAERNLKLYVVIKVCGKRVYLPLIAIYFVDVGGLTLEELGFYGAIAAFIKLILEVPSGYFSDKISRNLSYVIMGTATFLATTCFVLFQNKTGILIGVILEAIGYAFFSGTGPALVKESLTELGRKEDLSKVLTQAQSKSLFINTFLIALIPMTYAIDERIPFIAGMIQHATLVIAALFLKDIRQEIYKSEESFNRKWLSLHKSFLIFAVLFGLFAALYTAPSNFRNLVHQANNIPPEYLGWMFAGASLLASVFGARIYKLKDIGVKRYAALDSFLLLIGFALFIPPSAIL